MQLCPQMKRIILLYSIVLTITSCGIDSESVDVYVDEKSIELVYPESGTEVRQGNPIADGQSELVLKWKDLNEAMNYQLHLIEMPNSKTSIVDSDTTETSVVLKNGTLYKWFISVPTTRRFSEIASFKYVGPESGSLAPMPATAISPISGASISSTSTTVNLRWNSEDPDDNIIGYDLFFGEQSNPPLLFSDVEENNMNGIPVEEGKVYYWKIITKDANGNESISDIFNFSVG